MSEHRPHVEKSGTVACPACLEEWPCLAEQGRRLASEREDLIAQGVNPSLLAIPLHPTDPGPHGPVVGPTA